MTEFTAAAHVRGCLTERTYRDIIWIMKISATRLRQNLYNILDEVLETGQPVEIERKGRVLRIVPEKQGSIFDRLEEHPDAIVGDPEELVHRDWSSSWKGARDDLS